MENKAKAGTQAVKKPNRRLTRQNRRRIKFHIISAIAESGLHVASVAQQFVSLRALGPFKSRKRPKVKRRKGNALSLTLPLLHRDSKNHLQTNASLKNV